MKRLLTQVILTALVAALLAACSNPGAGERLTVRLDSTGNLGYEIDDSGKITVTTRSLVFRNAPGEPVAAINGVRARYYDAAGRLLEQWETATNSLSIVVPAGFGCADPDPVMGCTMLSAGAYPAYSEATAPADAQLQLLPDSVAIAHASRTGPGNWWATFTFTGENAFGAFEVDRDFYIVAPN